MFRRDQLARSERFHHRDSDAALFAEPVELRPDRIHAGHEFAGSSDHLLQLGIGRHHVEGGVDAEHQQIHHAALDDPPCRHRVVGACADRPAFQILRVLQNVRLERRRIVRRRIDEEEHAEVDVVGSETAKQRFEVASANGRIAADVVLLVQVHRADVPLNHHPVAPSGEGPADVRTHLLTGHEEVHEIDAVVQCRVDRFFDDGVRFAVEMFASEADHAGLQSGSADLTIFHDRAPLNWKVSCFPGTVCSGTQYNTHSG